MSAPRRRVAVYNRYWTSQGGGERYSGKLAQVLADFGADVELIGHEDIDTDKLGDHLGLDLSRCHLRLVPDAGEAMMSELSAEYDLFVNASYMSSLPSMARKSAYVCYFPTPVDHDLEVWRKWAIRAFGRLARPGPRFVHLNWGRGWFPSEGGRRRRWTWTSGEATLQIAAGDALELRFDLGRPGQAPTQLTVWQDDAQIAVEQASEAFRSVRVHLPAAPATRVVRFSSPTFTPSDNDNRQLGVAVSRMRFTGGGFRARERLGLRFPWLLRDPRNFAYLDTYDTVLGVSQYTVDWIGRFWQHEAEVLYPPIQVERFPVAATRVHSIVSAGRFFAPGEGHSKRQLELVRTFGGIVRSGGLDGWTLHLVGGCESRQRGYLDEVRAAAAGLPVEIHANAPRRLLEELMSTSAIQWSATGFGEDDTKAPWNSEHFGMTTVEAMAGGCVPIVIDKAGQREIVRDGVDGFRWSTLEQLVERTLQVAGDEGLRERLAASATQRAQTYSDAAFAHAVKDLAARHALL